MKYDNNDREPKDINKNPDSIALDDERRVKVLSPSMLVFKRFIRNRLAITGAIFIIFMLLFSFLGGWLMPYDESERFYTYTDMSKDYAGVSENTDYKFTTVDGSEFPLVARSKFVLAINNQNIEMSAQDTDYIIETIGEDLYYLYRLDDVAIATMIGKKYDIVVSGEVGDAGFKDAFEQAISSEEDSFESGGQTYIVVRKNKNLQACIADPAAVVSMNIFDFVSSDSDTGYEFKYNAEMALNDIKSSGSEEGSKQFKADDEQYTIERKGVDASIYDSSGSLYANVSRYIVQAVYPDIFLTVDYKTMAKNAIIAGQTEFTFADETGGEKHFTIERKNTQWTIRWIENTKVTDDYASPSWAHPLGTDGNGMDVLTRLMYGGRVSLMIGFIVVFIETIIGVVLGGIAGYFKKYLDNLIMRLVDIFYCIPSLPLIIILGAMMNELRVEPQIRMLYLMVIMGVLGWPGVARMVRGQILSLREQEFMVAAEATGLSSYRRIFKHLVPNVIPQIIVMSTTDLGNVIILESTLSFLGLGVKFPFASWGNIINDVNNVHVLMNYLFVWIPAGLCILITVLGFNFIGDGLRDAFDPKMKR